MLTLKKLNPDGPFDCGKEYLCETKQHRVFMSYPVFAWEKWFFTSFLTTELEGIYEIVKGEINDRS